MKLIYSVVTSAKIEAFLLRARNKDSLATSATIAHVLSFCPVDRRENKTPNRTLDAVEYSAGRLTILHLELICTSLKVAIRVVPPQRSAPFSLLAG